VSFQDSAACTAALRLVGQANVSVRLVCCASTAPAIPLYLRVYVNRAGIVGEVRQWGTLKSPQLWSALLAQCESGPFLEERAPP
jgi:hypothetical protein